MSYTPYISQSLTSEYGVNSYSATTGPLWTGDVFTGLGEQNDYNYVSVNLQVDEAGVLTFQFSQDGTNWSSYPTTQFTIASGINEVHGAWKGTRYVRPYFSGATGTRTYFRLRTMYSYEVVQLSAPINQSINSDSDATIVRAITIGQEPNGIYSNEKKDGVGFQTTDNLSSGATFNSDVISTDGYTQVQTHIVSSNNGTLGFKFCSTSDCSGTTVGQNGVERYISLQYTSSSGFQLFSAPAFTPYVQYSFTNDGTGTTTQLFYETKLLTKPLSGQLLALNSSVSKSMVANLGRSIIMGQDNAGNFRNSTVDAEGHLKVHIDEPLGAFGELRTAEVTPIIQVTHPYEINYDVLSSGGTGSGYLSYDSTNTLLEINSGAATSSSALMRTNSLAKYRNGQGMLIRFTSVFDTPKSGNTQWAGWGDSEGGFFFGYSGTTFGTMRRYNSVDYFNPQTNWVIDKFDGSLNTTNPSGELLNPQYGNVYEMQIQWLGYGAVRFNIEGNESGQFEPADVIKYANQNLLPSVTNPSFPIYFESKNTTNDTNVVIKNASFAAFVEGAVKYTGRNYSFRNSTASTTNTPLFTLNVPSTYKGKTNRGRIKLKSYSVIADQSNGSAVSFLFVKNATMTGLSYSQVSPYSIVSGSTVGAYSGGTGRVIYDIELNKVSNATGSLEELDLFVNAGETLSIIANGSNSGVALGLSWVEDI